MMPKTGKLSGVFGPLLELRAVDVEGGLRCVVMCGARYRAVHGSGNAAERRL